MSQGQRSPNLQGSMPRENKDVGMIPVRKSNYPFRPKKELQQLLSIAGREQGSFNEINQSRRRRDKSWLPRQKVRAILFMDFNKKILNECLKKSPRKFFLSMGKFVKTKNTQECQSYYYEHKQRFINFDDWIAEEIQIIGREVYNAKLEKCLPELSMIRVQDQLAETLPTTRVSKKNIDSMEPKSDLNQPQSVQLLSQLNLHNSIMPKNQQLNANEAIQNDSETLRRNIREKCAFHWQQWLKYTLIMESVRKMNYKIEQCPEVKKQE